jgi:glycerophosphoryl diester phosphodiesterase
MLMNGAGSGGGERFMEDCKRGGKEVCVWTVNTAEEMRWCARWGVKAIITDRVAYCVSVREQVSMAPF